MEKQGQFVNVKTRDGKVLLSLYFNPGSGVVLESRLDTNSAQGREYKGSGGNGGNGRNGGNGSSSDNGDGMTYPQKRLLFRLMAQQGVEGASVQKELMKLFQVDEFSEITKHDASRMIEQLLKEAKEGGNGNGLPF